MARVFWIHQHHYRSLDLDGYSSHNFSPLSPVLSWVRDVFTRINPVNNCVYYLFVSTPYVWSFLLLDRLSKTCKENKYFLINDIRNRSSFWTALKCVFDFLNLHKFVTYSILMVTCVIIIMSCWRLSNVTGLLPLNREGFYFGFCRDKRHLPVLFSMLHPLDEVSSVICRTGGELLPLLSFTQMNRKRKC